MLYITINNIHKYALMQITRKISELCSGEWAYMTVLSPNNYLYATC